jgi:hypothetical protein
MQQHVRKQRKGVPISDTLRRMLLELLLKSAGLSAWSTPRLLLLLVNHHPWLCIVCTRTFKHACVGMHPSMAPLAWSLNLSHSCNRSGSLCHSALLSRSPSPLLLSHAQSLLRPAQLSRVLTVRPSLRASVLARHRSSSSVQKRGPNSVRRVAHRNRSPPRSYSGRKSAASVCASSARSLSLYWRICHRPLPPCILRSSRSDSKQ